MGQVHFSSDRFGFARKSGAGHKAAGKNPRKKLFGVAGMCVEPGMNEYPG